MELSKRMRMNADLVPDRCRLADVGCDHGYVSIYLAEAGRCGAIFAADVREGPLSIARKNVRERGLENVICCRLGDGLPCFEPGEADTALIAGLGGMLMCRILSESPEVLASMDCLVLQPQSDWEQVRRTVYEKGFGIEREAFCVDEGKPYVAFRARRREKLPEEPPYTEAEFRYGRFLTRERDSGYLLFLQNECEKLLHIIEQLKTVETEAARDRTKELLHILECARAALRDAGCGFTE